nr:GNAT family N-acetyltransferase [Desulfatitalea alkaliphila]
MAFETVDVTYEIELPASWDDYLQQLNGKQRHEVRRKIRRLENEARFAYHRVPAEDDLESAVATFIDLFRRNRTDKAAFMTGSMPDFFKALMQRLDQEGMLRLQMLDVNDHPVAAVLCFDYQGVRYLYNSGYDAEHDHLSVGILSKVFGIRSAIALGCRRFDFLRGAEIYKKRTGGKEIGLHRCRGQL